MRQILAALVLGATTLLTACDSGANASAAASASASAVAVNAYEHTANNAKGFAVGNLMSTNTVYVYFDAQCPHCGHLWENMKPLHSKAKFVWIPVGMLSGASFSQGSALLAAADPLKAMNEHEASLLKTHVGMSAPVPSTQEREVILANSKALMKIGGDSVPYIVAKHALTGALVTQAGAASPEQLAKLLGISL
jgi:thiol:disulfide interchange protein DsbG